MFIMYSFSFLLFLCSQNWFMVWTSMELNTIMFLYFIMKTPHQQKMESLMTYFMIQAVSSLMFLFSLLNAEMTSLVSISSPSLLMILAIGMKLGVSPFQNWFISTASFCSAKSLWMLLCAQKTIPLFLMFMFKTSMSIFFVMFILLSGIMGSVINMKQNWIKLLLTVSSISNLGWMMTSTTSSPIMEFYFMIYCWTLLFTIEFVNNSNKTNSLKKNNYFLFIVLMTLSGIPPLLGFFPKALLMMHSISTGMLMIMMFLIMSSIIDLFVYSRISLPLVFKKKVSLKWQKLKEKKMNFFFMTNMLFLSMLML